MEGSVGIAKNLERQWRRAHYFTISFDPRPRRRRFDFDQVRHRAIRPTLGAWWDSFASRQQTDDR